ncbi:MAG: LCP family protein [Erysipelotrichaceae bacterium]
MTNSKKKKRKVKWGRLIFLLCSFILIVTLLLGAIGGAIFYAYLNYQVGQVKDTNIVVMGIDGREATDNTNRTDALLMASVDFEGKKLELVSFPRDSYVYIPCEKGGVKDKITHAYRYGEKECTLETLRGLLELDKLDTYVIVNFEKMILLIDELKGINLTPTKSFCELGTSDQQICFTEGQDTLMSGEMALAYSRHRKTDNDIKRAQRQQEVIKAIVNKAKNVDLWTMYQFGTKALKTIDTNLNITQLYAFYKLSLEDEFVINQNKAKGYDAYLISPIYKEKSYYYVLDEDWLKDYKSKIKNN